MDVEDDEVDKEVSQHDEYTQPIGKGNEPVDPEGEGDGDEDQEQELETNEVEKEQDLNENENDKEENEDQEVELQPAHRTEALDVLTSIELKFAML